MTPARFLGLLLIAGLLVALAGCGADSSATPDATGTGGVRSGSAGVEVTGSTDAAPQVTVPDADPPTELTVDTLVEGDGDVVEAGDLLLADYAGALWDTGEEFDSSWSRGQPAAFGIGVGQVIPGWDEALVGQTIGSRVLLVIPPELAYGDQENETIPADSTLVFVVDVRDAFSAADAAGGTEVTDLPDGLPTVTGEPGEEPEVDVADVEAPEQSTSLVIVEGDGEPIDPGGTIVVHATQSALDSGELLFSTWQSAPQQVEPAGLPGLAEALDGQNVGTRALTLVSADDNDGQALVLVVDVLGSLPPAAPTPDPATQ